MRGDSEMISCGTRTHEETVHNKNQSSEIWNTIYKDKNVIVKISWIRELETTNK